MKPDEAFGQVLLELRRERGLSQEKLAELTECTRPYISYLERGLNSPSLSIVFRLAAGLGVSPTELIHRVESKLAERLSTGTERQTQGR